MKDDSGNRHARSGAGPALLHEELTRTIRQTAYEVHRYFGVGFLELVYHNALRNRLEKQGLDVRPERFTVLDEDGSEVGVYLADLVVGGIVLIEVKATTALCVDHEAQVLNYLRASGLRVGVLINFGTSVLQFRRFRV